MAAKVFISCGQRPGRESEVSTHLKTFFETKGYEPYVAIQVQTILDLNSGIIGALKQCDYYVFVNFARETVDGDGAYFRRGSLYSHQELATAYVLGFEKLIILNEVGVKNEGMQQSIIVNTPSFSSDEELFAHLESALKASQWTPAYSRHLRFTELFIPGSMQYGDHTTGPHGRFQKHFLGKVQNNRNDLGALLTIARLDGYFNRSDGVFSNSTDQSALKASYAKGYSHTIFPRSSQFFDLFTLHHAQPGKLFLNSELDRPERHPIISTPGDYILCYSVFATGFPVLNFRVSVHLNECLEKTTASVDLPLIGEGQTYSHHLAVPTY